MRVLVSGASGFIGGALVDALRSRHEPRSADREALRAADTFRGCDAVVHLANIAHASADRAELERVNVEGTRYIAELAASQRVRRFVYLSSVKACAEETLGRALTGKEIPAPTTNYGRAKLTAENALAEVAARTGLEAISLRPPLVYGPGVKANFLALLRALARGWPLPFAGIDNRRSLIYVGNLVAAITACLEAPASATGRAYFVSDGAAVSTPQLCRALGEALGRPVRLFSFPQAPLARLPMLRALVRSLEVDDAAFRRALGWGPPFSLTQGLRETARWYQSR